MWPRYLTSSKIKKIRIIIMFFIGSPNCVRYILANNYRNKHFFVTWEQFSLKVWSNNEFYKVCNFEFTEISFHWMNFFILRKIHVTFVIDKTRVVMAKGIINLKLCVPVLLIWHILITWCRINVFLVTKSTFC